VEEAAAEEVETRSDACRHGAEEAHSLRAPLVEPEKVAAVEASDDAVPLARARCGVQVVAGPCVARVEMPEPCVARRGAPGAPGPRVARWGRRGHWGRVWRGEGHQWHRGHAWLTSGATNGTGTAGGARGLGATGGARASGVPEGPAGKGKTETGGCTTRSENMDSMSGSGVGVEEEKGKSDSSNTTCRDIRTRREVRS
jgi:hypothetical protein